MFTKLWSFRHQFVKYAATGCSAFVLDYGSYLFLTEIVHITPTLTLVIYQPFVLLYVFWLNKRWSFKNSARFHRQLVRFFGLSAWNYTFSIATTHYFYAILGFDHRLVRLASIVTMVSWNFFLYKFWVYRSYTQEENGPT